MFYYNVSVKPVCLWCCCPSFSDSENNSEFTCGGCKDTIRFYSKLRAHNWIQMSTILKLYCILLFVSWNACTCWSHLCWYLSRWFQLETICCFSTFMHWTSSNTCCIVHHPMIWLSAYIQIQTYISISFIFSYLCCVWKQLSQLSYVTLSWTGCRRQCLYCRADEIVWSNKLANVMLSDWAVLHCEADRRKTTR